MCWLQRDIQTWKDPVSDVVIFLVENPPAAIVRFADQVGSVLITVETDLPQTSSVERTVLVNTYPPWPSPETDQTQYKRQNNKHSSKI